MKVFFIFLVRGYQLFISPLLGPKCRFYPTCSHYCLHCLEKLPIHRALWYSGRRILKCHPFHPGGVDPAPEK